MKDHDDNNFHEFFNEYPLGLFIGLHSLRLYIGKWPTKADIILSQINSLNQLTGLQIKFYCLSSDESVRHVLDLIYSRKDNVNLSALKKLYLQSYDSAFIIELSTATKMKRINLRHLSLYVMFLHDLPNAIPHMQQIRSLEVENLFCKVEVRATMIYQKPLAILPQCTHLTIKNMGDNITISDLQFLFTHFPLLRQLSIEVYRDDDENHQWELILSKYLPNLLEFKLKNKYSSSSKQFLQKLAKLQSYYQTSFWTDRHVKLSLNTNETFLYVAVEFKLKEIINRHSLFSSFGLTDL